MAAIIFLERFMEIITKNRLPTLRLSEFLDIMTRQVNQNTPASGSGSPEGVVTAEPFNLYVDTAGGAGTVLYVKQSGSGNTGWILV